MQIIINVGHKMNKYFNMGNRNMTCETMRSKPLTQDSARRWGFVATAINF